MKKYSSSPTTSPPIPKCPTTSGPNVWAWFLSAGYTVLAAADGEEAIRVFDANRDAVCLAVLDAIMPKRTGHEVHRYIKEVSPHTPVVFCTGYDRDTARLQNLVNDETPTIQKPFTRQTLLSVVRKTLDAKPQCQLT